MVEILTGGVIRGHLLIRGNSITQSRKVLVVEAQGTHERKDKFKASQGHISNVSNAKIHLSP